VSEYRRAFEVRWRGRAATALGIIGGDTALAALDSVLRIQPQDRLDSALKRMVERARMDSNQLALEHYP
jgi:hypothetical protein